MMADLGEFKASFVYNEFQVCQNYMVILTPTSTPK